MQTTTPFANEIATYLTMLGAAGHNFKEPIKWASGTFNPFYVDNRKLQSDPFARKVLRKALASLVENKDAVDYIYGIPKAGIAPAVLLALEINKPLLLKLGSDYFSVDFHYLKEQAEYSLTELMKSADMIAGTMPLGTALGLIIAESQEKPFLFVRQEEKDHGLKKQVEGIIVKNEYCLLVDPVCSLIDSYTLSATRALNKEGMRTLNVYSPNVEECLYKINIVGKNIVVMEDLISTGESSVKEIISLKDQGAKVSPRSIFSYELPSAVENFKKHGLVNKAVLNFTDLMQFYSGSDSKIKIDMIWDWYHDQENWGDNNRFPREVKN